MAIKRRKTPFGVWLDEQQERMGIRTNADLGAALGLSHVTIFKWKSGQQGPSPRHIALLARVLHVSQADVLRALSRLEDDREWPEDVRQVANALAAMTPERRRRIWELVKVSEQLLQGELSLRPANALRAVGEEENEPR